MVAAGEAVNAQICNAVVAKLEKRIIKWSHFSLTCCKDPIYGMA